MGKISPHRTDPPWAKRERNGFNEFREAHWILKKAANGDLASSLRGSTCRKGTGSKESIRSHVTEASESNEAWHLPPRPFADCGLAGQPC